MDHFKTFLRSHHWSLVVWTTVAGLGVRLVIFVLFGEFFVGGDTEIYTNPAHTLLNGEPFDPFTRTPTYPLFIAGILWLFDYDYRWVVLVQHILGVSTALLFYGAFRLLFPKAVISSYFFLVALLFDKHLLFWGHLVQTEALFVFIESSIILLLVLWGRKPSVLISILLGVQLGLLVLCRPVGVVFIPVILIAMLVMVMRRHAKNVSYGFQLISLVAPLFLILGGWMVRNHILHGTFSIVSSPHLIGGTLFGATAEFIDYDSPLHAVLKERLRPVLADGYAEINRQLGSGTKRVDVRYKGSHAYNWLSESEPQRIVEEYAREDLARKGVPESEIDENSMRAHYSKIREDLAFEAIRNNGGAYLTKWVVPEFFTLFLLHTASPDTFLSGAWMLERFYNSLIPEKYANPDTPLPLLYDRLLKQRRSDLNQISDLRRKVKSELVKGIHLLNGKGADLNGMIYLLSESSLWAARPSHKVLLIADGLFKYSPFPFSAILGFVYFGVLILLLVGLFRRGESTGASSPEALWAVMLIPLPYGLVVAAFNDAIVRYVVPIEPFLWFAGVYAILRVGRLWDRAYTQTV